MSNEQWTEYEKASKMIKESSIRFDDSTGITIPEMRSKIRKHVDLGLALIVVDQLEQIRGHEGLPAYVQMDKNAYAVKDLGKEFDIPVAMAHQLNRGITDRKLKNPEPQMSDLNQAGEKPSNQIWIINHQRDEKGNILQSKIKIVKNRNGPRIEFPVMFLGERMLFGNPAHPDQTDSKGYNNNGNFDDDDNADLPWGH
jgi:replicative DNA helicase